MQEKKDPQPKSASSLGKVGQISQCVYLWLFYSVCVFVFCAFLDSCVCVCPFSCFCMNRSAQRSLSVVLRSLCMSVCSCCASVLSENMINMFMCNQAHLHSVSFAYFNMQMTNRTVRFGVRAGHQMQIGYSVLENMRISFIWDVSVGHIGVFDVFFLPW